jgi:hypothetical protein
MAFTVHVHVDEIDQLQARQVSHELLGVPPSLNLTLRCPDHGRLTVSGWPEELRALLLACLDVVDQADPDPTAQPTTPTTPAAVA